jgi:hypothetical protein
LQKVQSYANQDIGGGGEYLAYPRRWEYILDAYMLNPGNLPGDFQLVATTHAAVALRKSGGMGFVFVGGARDGFIDKFLISF